MPGDEVQPDAREPIGCSLRQIGMRRLLLSLLTCLLALPVAVLTAAPAHACSCERPERESTLEESDLIAEVTVTGEHEADRDRIYDLQVQREWKGPGAGQIQVSTGRDVTACGLALREGRSYVLFAHGSREQGWSSSWCTATFAVGTQTTIVSRADVEQRYGAGTVPAAGDVVDRRSDEVSTWEQLMRADLVPWAILAAVLLLLTLLALSAALVRRMDQGTGR